MSTRNAISIEIPENERQALKDALNTMKEILTPYLIALSMDQRKTVPKMGDGTVPFVNKTMDYVASNPDFAPRYLKIEEMKKDYAAVQVLMPVLQEINQLQSNLSDTVMMAGSEAYVAALSYYHTVKRAMDDNQPGAKAIYEDLKARFERSSQSSDKSNGEITE